MSLHDDLLEQAESEENRRRAIVPCFLPLVETMGRRSTLMVACARSNLRRAIGPVTGRPGPDRGPPNARPVGPGDGRGLRLFAGPPAPVASTTERIERPARG